MSVSKELVGERAMFFHPRTMGVMHWGKVVGVLANGLVRVHFDVDNKVHTTYTDRIRGSNR